jgi:hypothetical protein
MTPPDDTALLARLDERTKATAEDVAEIKKAMAANYVTKAEFAPVRSIVFGMVAAILLAVLGVLLAMAGLGK